MEGVGSGTEGGSDVIDVPRIHSGPVQETVTASATGDRLRRDREQPDVLARVDVHT
jgi:hypothetical protein